MSSPDAVGRRCRPGVPRGHRREQRRRREDAHRRRAGRRASSATSASAGGWRTACRCSASSRPSTANSTPPSPAYEEALATGRRDGCARGRGDDARATGRPAHAQAATCGPRGFMSQRGRDQRGRRLDAGVGVRRRRAGRVRAAGRRPRRSAAAPRRSHARASPRFRPTHPIQGHGRALMLAIAAKQDLARRSRRRCPRDAARRRVEAAVGTKDMPIVAAVGVAVAELAAADRACRSRRPRCSAPPHACAGPTMPRTSTSRRSPPHCAKSSATSDSQAAYEQGRALDRDAAIARLDPTTLPWTVEPAADHARRR